jgi:hypothetical protein
MVKTKGIERNHELQEAESWQLDTGLSLGLGVNMIDSYDIQ